MMASMVADECEEVFMDDIITLRPDLAQTRFESTTQSTDNVVSATPSAPSLGQDSDSKTYGSKTIVLPVTFFNISSNLRLLNECRPFSIKIVDCDKHPWYYKNYNMNSTLNCYNLPDITIRRTSVSIDLTSPELSYVVNRQTPELTTQITKPLLNNDTREASQPKSIIKDSHITIEQNLEHLKQRQEKEKAIAITKKNLSQVNLKRNVGLIGFKITSRVNDVVNGKSEQNNFEIRNNKESGENDNEYFVGVDKVLSSLGTTIVPVNGNQDYPNHIVDNNDGVKDKEKLEISMSVNKMKKKKKQDPIMKRFNKMFKQKVKQKYKAGPKKFANIPLENICSQSKGTEVTVIPCEPSAGVKDKLKTNKYLNDISKKKKHECNRDATHSIVKNSSEEETSKKIAVQETSDIGVITNNSNKTVTNNPAGSQSPVLPCNFTIGSKTVSQLHSGNNAQKHETVDLNITNEPKNYISGSTDYKQIDDQRTTKLFPNQSHANIAINRQIVHPVLQTNDIPKKAENSDTNKQKYKASTDGKPKSPMDAFLSDINSGTVVTKKAPAANNEVRVPKTTKYLNITREQGDIKSKNLYSKNNKILVAKYIPPKPTHKNITIVGSPIQTHVTSRSEYQRDNLRNTNGSILSNKGVATTSELRHVIPHYHSVPALNPNHTASKNHVPCSNVYKGFNLLQNYPHVINMGDNSVNWQYWQWTPLPPPPPPPRPPPPLQEAKKNYKNSVPNTIADSNSTVRNNATIANHNTSHAKHNISPQPVPNSTISGTDKTSEFESLSESYNIHLNKICESIDTKPVNSKSEMFQILEKETMSLYNKASSPYENHEVLNKPVRIVNSLPEVPKIKTNLTFITNSNPNQIHHNKQSRNYPNTNNAHNNTLPKVTEFVGFNTFNVSMNEKRDDKSAEDNKRNDKSQKNKPTLNASSDCTKPLTAICKPRIGPLSKMKKLNNISLTPPHTEKAGVYKGYSPPILPIPTTLEILCRSNSEQNRLPINKIEHQESSNSQPPTNEIDKPKKGISFEKGNKSAKKISLEKYMEKYKERVSKPRYKFTEERPPKRTKLDTENMVGKVVNIHSDQDLGYDSDATVVLNHTA